MKQTPEHSSEQDLFTRTIAKICCESCVKEYKFHEYRKWRFDYAIPSKKIAIEVEGGVWIQGRHNRANGFLGDMEKYNTATAMGWRLLRTTPQELMTTKFIGVVKKTVEFCF